MKSISTTPADTVKPGLPLEKSPIHDFIQRDNPFSLLRLPLTSYPHFSWQKFGDKLTKDLSMAVDLTQKISLRDYTIARSFKRCSYNGPEMPQPIN